MTLDEILAQLRAIDPEMQPDEQQTTRKILLDETLSAADVDLPALTAAVMEKGKNVDPADGDITEEALQEFELLTEISASINERVDRITDQRAREQRAEHAAKLAARIADTKILDNKPIEGIVSASGGAPAVRSNGVPQTRRETVAMAAASDMPGFFSGQSIPDMRSLTAAVISRARSLSRSGSTQQVPLATLNRQVPETHLIQDEMRDWHRLEAASDETRLPGGSLAASILKKQNTLTASTPIPGSFSGYAWCGPMDIRPDEYCPIDATLDGLLDLPTIVTTRGGVMWPETPSYMDLYQPFCFSDEDVHGGYDLQKPCVELPCPDGWQECKLKGCSLCLETGIIQSRVAPELVQRSITELLIAHQHHLNRTKIQEMMDQIALSPGGHTDMTAWGNHGPGAFESLLSFIDLQATRMRERRKLALNTTLEAIFPRWVLGILRADLSKKNAIQGRWSVGEPDVITYLLSRGIRAQFVRDWQDDYFTQDATPTQWPTQVSFMLYQAGAFSSVAGPTIQLEMIHDKALLQRNREIRLFVEDLYCVIWRCFQAASFTVPLCPNGVSGGQEVIECTDVPLPTPAGASVRVA